MLTLVLALCAWTTASAFDLKSGTLNHCTVTFKVDDAAAVASPTTADATNVITIIVAPESGYSSSLDGIKATASMGTGNMQARRRADLIKDIEVTQAMDGETPIVNTYIIASMPAANVTVDVTCEAVAQTVTFPEGLTVEDWTDPDDQTKTGKMVTDPTTGNQYIISPAAPKTNETVTITPLPVPGWQLPATTPITFDPTTGDDVNATDDNADGIYTYVQPPYGGQLTVTFVKTAYTVTLTAFTNGAIAYEATTRAAGDPTTPADNDFYVGDVVTLTITPTTAGYQLQTGSLTATYLNPDPTGDPIAITLTQDATDKSKWTLTMPAGNMTVAAVFGEEITEAGDAFTVSLASTSLTYTGSAIEPAVTVKKGDDPLTEGTDYSVTYTNNTNAAAATAENAPTVTVTGKGTYAGVVTKAFTITPASGTISYATTTVDKTYGDADFTNTLTQTYDPATAANGTNIGTITYQSNNTSVATVNSAGNVTIKSAGTATITATATDGSNVIYSGMADYNATTHIASVSYTLTVSNATISATATGYEGVYDGAAHGISVSVTTPASDYTVNYGMTSGTYDLTTSPTLTDAGSTTVYYSITASNYNTKTGSATIVISQKSVTADMIGDIAEQSYTGGPLTPELTVTDGTTPLVAGTDYTVAYTSNIEPGTATATITGQGNYTGTAQKTFTIVNNNTPDTEDEASITIGATGKSTFVSTRDVDFTNSTAKAYIAVGYDKGSNELTLSRIYKVPAGTPVMVKADNPGLFEVPFTTGATYEYLNLLVGNTSASTVEIGETAGSNTNYVLTQGEFKSVTNNAYIPTGKAYLQLPSSFPAAHAGSALTVTLTASGKSTLCSSVDLDFSAVSGMKAYVATGYDRQTKRVMLSHVQKVSAGTPLVLHGRSNTTYTIPSVAAQTTFVNMFVGNNSGAAITVYPTSGSMKNYYLGSGEFKAVVDYLTVPDGKAYLQLPASAGARSTTRSSDDDDFLMEVNDETLVIRLDGADATSVEGLLKAAAEQDVYYNLNGQRTENPGKGIYVKKGQKLVIK